MYFVEGGYDFRIFRFKAAPQIHNAREATNGKLHVMLSLVFVTSDFVGFFDNVVR